MKSLLLTPLFILVFQISSFAQEASPVETTKDTSYWQKGGSYNLNFTRVSLNNWAGGGQGSVSLASNLKLFANYKKDKTSWDNSFDLAYGITKAGEQEFRKSDDQLIILSKYGHKMKENLHFSVLADYRSQVAPGYLYETDPTDPENEISSLISQFMAPGYLVTSVGFEYKKGEFYTLLSPVTGKTTFVLEQTLADAGAFGVEVGENIRFELGALLKMGYKRQLMKNVDFSTTASFFSSYERFEHIDINWETTFQFKINDYLSSTFSTQLIYDDDIDVLKSDGTVGPAVQYKDVLNIGLLYKF